MRTRKKIYSHFIDRIFPSFLPIVFLVIALVTISDYGLNWDSPVHFARGQAFLRYMLTGKTDYVGLPQFCQDRRGINNRVDYLTGEVCDKTRRTRVSEYESRILDFQWAKKITYGHPAFSDLMLAASNQIFFKWLGFFEDIDAYHIFPIVMTFILLLTVAYWAKITFGTFASIVSVLSVGLFPLLFAEQHFNVKDPPVGAFFTLAIFFFWRGITKKKARFLLLSGLFGGMSFATKVNYVFAPVILLPWMLYYILAYIRFQRGGLLIVFSKKTLSTIRKLFPPRLLVALLLYPIIVAAIFYFSWPALWFDTKDGVLQFIKYYREIGVKVCPYPRLSPLWFFSCSDLLTIKYFFYSLPIPTVIFFLIGAVIALRKRREFSFVTVLWLSFFFVTLLRVTFSVASIYGGLRQIMEFVAPLGFLAGLGAVYIRDSLVRILVLYTTVAKRTLVILVSALILGGYVPVILTLIKLHPNENLYFNLLIGGVSGAAASNFTGFGNTYGNVYLQGVNWMNENAESDAHFALVFGLASSISRPSLRNDILYDNSYRSGYNMKGEYQLAQLLQGDPQKQRFGYQFLNKFLHPIYIVSVDGVPILKIWKNEPKYLKNGMHLDPEEEAMVISEQEESTLVLQLKTKKKLKRIEFYYPPVCEIPVKMALISIGTSLDNLQQLPFSPQNFTQSEIQGYEGSSVYFFLGEETRFVHIRLEEKGECDIKDILPKLFVFTNL